MIGKENMKKLYILLAVVFAVSGVRAATISLVNAGFEDTSGAVKIIGFDSGTDVPGWNDVGANADSGVQDNPPWSANSGTTAAFFENVGSGNAGAEQITGYTIQDGDVFAIGFYANNIAAATELTLTVVDDAGHVLGSYKATGFPANNAYQYYTAYIAATAASVGNQVGIQFANTTGGNSWVGLDDVSLAVGEFIPDPTSARPTTAPVATVDLSGSWDFDPDNRPKTTIQVPGGGWYKQGFTGTDEADYSRTITVPDLGQPQVTRLEFGAINYEADLYIDGTFVANSVQAYTPASFDVSGYVTPGSTHDIRVHVKGMGARMSGGRSLDPNGAGSWADFLPQGIFRSAELKIYPKVYISDVFVRPSVADSELYYDVWLRNESTTAANITLSGNLSSWNGDTWSYPNLPDQPVSLSAGESTKVTVGPVAWNLGTNSYWWPNVPYQEGYQAQLHNLNLSLAPTGGGAAIHSNTTRFGFRECTQGPDGQGNTCYFLNGIRVNFRGDSFQGANYDRIDNGGQGNAFDTYPGFLPGANGWPKAVDNFQRLNYNVVRIHQIPASPYMLDVCDEMGLMIINETGIRGAGDQQDFINGHDNMVNHLKALFTRDRNHASVVRLSQSNEPDWSGTNSEQFQIDLYNAAMEVDGTRPISVDPGANPFNNLQYPNFATFPHYGTYNNSWGQYTDEVYARSDRPYGSGEFIWFADNSKQGFAWFATATQAMRAKGASDIRPYTLLSAWAGVIPGTATTDMRLEDPPAGWAPSPLYPLYGENNLPNPWSNPQIQRVQAGFNPVLVADADYWESVKLSNANGDWPANVPFLTPNQSVTRTLNIYNDTFSGTDVDVFWELRVGSPAGAIADSGVVHATVPLGYTVSEDISFTTPYVDNDTILYLVLRSEKGGVEMFREESQQFRLLNAAKLSGSAFGTTPAYAAGNEYDKATDGDPGTFFDYANANGGYTGINLGAGNASKISYLIFTPRSGFSDRMVGGQFQGSNTGENSGYTTLHTVNTQPSGTTVVPLNTSTAYRYLRYVGPNGSYCNIAEMEFYSELLNAADAWRLLYFGTTANVGDAADDADFDGDGVINLLERAHGGNPTVADAHLLPGIDPSAPVLSMVYRKAAGASDLALEVQECPNLMSNSWATASGTSEVISDDGIIQSNRFTTPVDDPAKFLRVRVVSP